MIYLAKSFFSEPVSSDAFGKLQVLAHYRHSLRVDCAQIGVLEETDHVGFCCLLEGENCLALESDLLLELSGDLAHQTLERQLPDEEFGTFLVLPDLAECDCSWFEAMRLLDTRREGSSLSGDFLGNKLLPWYFLRRSLPRSLLCPCHFSVSSTTRVARMKSNAYTTVHKLVMICL